MKNSKYGNSALEPLNVFSPANAVAGIKMRIDDKLKRIKNAGLVDATEDTLQDLAGYLILLMIARDNASNDFQERLRQDQPASHPSDHSTWNGSRLGSHPLRLMRFDQVTKTKRKAPRCMFQRGVFVSG